VQTENGVPNVSAIQQRLAAGISMVAAHGAEPTLATLITAVRRGSLPASVATTTAPAAAVQVVAGSAHATQATDAPAGSATDALDVGRVPPFF
jgi:hypothetical protein